MQQWFLCVLLGYMSLSTLLWRIYVAGNNKTYLGCHVKYSISLIDFEKIWVSRQICIKVPSNKFHENPSRRSRADIYICGQTDRHNEAKWSFSDYANVPKGGPKPGIAKFISNRSKNTEGVGGTHGRVKNNISVEKHLKKRPPGGLRDRRKCYITRAKRVHIFAP